MTKEVQMCIAENEVVLFSFKLKFEIYKKKQKKKELVDVSSWMGKKYRNNSWFSW